MVDYLDNTKSEVDLSYDRVEFRDFFCSLDTLSKDVLLYPLDNNNILLSNFTPKSTESSYLKKELFKNGNDISQAILSWETNKNSLKEKLRLFKRSLLRTTDLKKRVIIKQRIKKLTELCSKLEHELLKSKISHDSHNTVLVSIFLKTGLYSISHMIMISFCR